MRTSAYLQPIPRTIAGLCLLLCLALCLPALAQQDLEGRSLRLAEQIEAGDFAHTLETLAPELRAQVGEAQLQAAMAQNRLLAGAFQEMLGTNRLEVPTGPVIDVYARHTGKPVRIRFPYDAQGHLVGLWVQPVSWEEVTALFPQAGAPLQQDERGEEHPVQVGAYALPGTLTVPTQQAVRLPIAVLLLAGSGPNDRDETMGEAANKPLRDLALGLAARGISSLRYDKRSLARPDALGAVPTIEQEVLQDAQAAITLLGEHALTRDAKPYVAGHSLGGMVTPALLRDVPALRGAAILAGSPRGLWEIVYDQNLAALEAMENISAEQREAALKEAARQRDLAPSIRADSGQVVFGMPAAYVASLNALRLADAARDTARPLLILQGGKDVQVFADKDFVAWQELLKGKEGVQFQLYPGLNHLFMEAQTGSVEEYNRPAHMHPQVIEDIADWLIAQAERD